MALNDEIITLADVRSIRDIDESYSDDRFSGYLREIQNIYLKQLFGDAMWYDFFKNISETKYQTLIDGETYSDGNDTVYYPGLKPYLSYYILLKVMIEGDVFHTNRGNFNYNPETARTTEKFQLTEVKGTYQYNIKEQENQIISYLNQKTSTYTLWDAKSKTNEIGFTFNIL